MPERSTIACLGILQQHGLTVELLELWVHFVVTGQTGPVTFHHDHGTLQRYELHGGGKSSDLTGTCLTKTSK